MPQDPAHYLNPVASQADFTYSITIKGIKIQDTGKGKKSVGDDLAAVLRKIEGWHQGSIARLPHRRPKHRWGLASNLVGRQGLTDE